MPPRHGVEPFDPTRRPNGNAQELAMLNKSRAIASAADAKAAASPGLLEATFEWGAALLHGFARKIADHRRRRRTEAILASLDDRTLQDIGIARSEIGSVVLNPGEERLREISGWRPYY
jgi:uncharacterized protein YjiS (DUF1127 family)